jgi:dsRNA-specific ribonuclease
MTPGQLTQARSVLVCNQFLGVIALNLNLPKHMRHMNEKLAYAVMVIDIIIQSYTTDFEKIQFNINSNPTELSDLFWNQLEVCPKTIADLYESLIGIFHFI